MRKISDMIVNFLVRMIIGVALIFFVNHFLMTNGIEVNVGINPLTVISSGVLGIPGVCLLYGILFLG